MSEVVILDTHIWFWFINQEFERFPSQWKTKIETANRVAISPISCFEIALAQQRGRLQLPCPTHQWFQEALAPSGIEIFPLTPGIADYAVNLPPIHKDPFDRLIIATALTYQANLVSVDKVFSQYTELDGYLM